MSCKPFPKIKAIRALCQQGHATDQGADCHDVPDTHWLNCGLAPVATPMSVHPQYAATRKSWGINAIGSLVVEVSDQNIPRYLILLRDIIKKKPTQVRNRIRLRMGLTG